LVEGPSKDPARLTGRTRSHRLIHFAAPESLVGEVISVKVTHANYFDGTVAVSKYFAGI